jgi:hypothetical protein
VETNEGEKQSLLNKKTIDNRTYSYWGTGWMPKKEQEQMNVEQKKKMMFLDNHGLDYPRAIDVQVSNQARTDVSVLIP